VFGNNIKIGFVLIAAATWMQPNELCRKNVKSLQSQCVTEREWTLKLHNIVVVKSTSSSNLASQVNRQKTSFCHSSKTLKNSSVGKEITTRCHPTLEKKLGRFSSYHAFLCQLQWSVSSTGKIALRKVKEQFNFVNFLHFTSSDNEFKCVSVWYFIFSLYLHWRVISCPLVLYAYHFVSGYGHCRQYKRDDQDNHNNHNNNDQEKIILNSRFDLATVSFDLTRRSRRLDRSYRLFLVLLFSDNDFFILHVHRVTRNMDKDSWIFSITGYFANINGVIKDVLSRWSKN